MPLRRSLVRTVRRALQTGRSFGASGKGVGVITFMLTRGAGTAGEGGVRGRRSVKSAKSVVKIAV